MTSKTLKNYSLIIVLFLSYISAQSQVSTVFDFNTSNQLLTEFTQGGNSKLITQSSKDGIGGSGTINVLGETDEIFTSKQGYSITGKGAHYEFKTYFKSEYNSGYGGFGFTSNPNAKHHFYAAPSEGLGISVHGGGYIFNSGLTAESGKWTNEDVLNSTSPDKWYLAVLSIDLLGNSYFDMTVNIYPSNDDGTLLDPNNPIETKTWKVQNKAMANSRVIYAYFAFGGHRITNFDNYIINLKGGSTSIEAGAPVVIGSSVLNNSTKQIAISGDVTDDRGDDVTEKGIVYSTSDSLPTTSDNKITIGSGNGSFSYELGSLLSNSIYYIRTYAKNSKGISYGSVSAIDTDDMRDIEIDFKAKIKTYPNPSTNYISLSGLAESQNYTIYNMQGKQVLRGTVTNDHKIEVKFLTKGMYLLKLENFEIIKFIKE